MAPLAPVSRRGSPPVTENVRAAGCPDRSKRRLRAGTWQQRRLSRRVIASRATPSWPGACATSGTRTTASSASPQAGSTPRYRACTRLIGHWTVRRRKRSVLRHPGLVARWCHLCEPGQGGRAPERSADPHGGGGRGSGPHPGRVGPAHPFSQAGRRGARPPDGSRRSGASRAPCSRPRRPPVAEKQCPLCFCHQWPCKPLGGTAVMARPSICRTVVIGSEPG